MQIKSTIAFLLLIILFLNSYSQFNCLSKNNNLWALTVYLGENRSDKFNSDIVKSIYAGDTLIIGFLEYQTYNTSRLNEFTKEDRIADGVIAASKIKRESFLYLQYTMGNGVDTCHINCKEALVNNWVGKSGLLSVINFAVFFIDGRAYMQPDPHGETKQIEKRGSVSIGTDTSQFFYSYHSKHPHGVWDGWMAEGSDSFHLRLPYNLATRKGKKMGVKQLQFDPGVIVEKDGVICAALDFGVTPVAVFILKELPEKEKLKIASFLLTILSEI